MSIINDCLDNWIGLRGMCDETEPKSGKYINTLPGISLELVADLSTEDKDSYKEVWEDIYEQSLVDIEADMLTGMRQYFKTNLILNNQVSGNFRSPHIAAAAENFRKGVILQLSGSKYTAIYLNHIRLYLKSAVDSSIYINDIDSGQLLDVIPFTGSIGVNVIQIEKQYFPEGSRQEIFVSWDANLSDTIEVASSGPYFQAGSPYVNERTGKVANGSAIIEENITFGIVDHGMIVNYNASCSIQAYICSIKQFMTGILMYKIGENIMAERLNSDRVNKYTLNSLEQVQELREEYSEKYRKLLDDTLNSIDKNVDDICVSCNKKRTFVTAIP